MAGLNFAGIDEELRCAYRTMGKPAPEGFEYQPPFALVCSNQYREMNGSYQPVRQYPWGECKIGDLEHSDFSLVK